ncbi:MULTISPECIES: leucine-rich repeat protein [unclassified Breznakia]|uniref:leucine-rich repeat domain-containing protein n=1 Tax=unclassified Breznakia TaxID=2623764 RepID=UPI002405A10F|nr:MULTISPECIES: leucine-rich repeat protein [unclassified Breznakia]MDF9837043.1 hypothetical protein [Breznakia sp. PFB2-8]MDF9858968.1 hypothetical protein [Breznakia sp. PH5-24]
MKRIKKLTMVSLAAIVVMVSITTFTISTLQVNSDEAEEFVLDNIRYKVLSENSTNGEVEVVGADNRNLVSSDLVIKSDVEYNGINYQITSIGADSFNNLRLTSVIIPEGVVSIGSRAFGIEWNENNNQLTSVILPSTLITIGDEAFYYNQLESIVIPENVISIGNYAFANNQLKSAILPYGIEVIGENAFGTNQLESIIIPDSVYSLGEYAFVENQLQSANIPVGLKEVPMALFCDNKLTSIEIPENVEVIGQAACAENQLTTINIPKNVHTIGGNAFGSNLLTNIIIPENVKILGPHAFLDNRITSVTLHDGIEEIGDGCFTRNYLTEIEVPKSITIPSCPVRYNRLENLYLSDESMISWFFDYVKADRILANSTMPKDETGNPGIVKIYAPKGNGANYADGTEKKVELKKNEVLNINLSIYDLYGQVLRFDDATDTYFEADPSAQDVKRENSINATISWYKDGNLLAGEDGVSLNNTMNETGVFTYYAIVNGQQLENIVVVVKEAPVISVTINPTNVEVKQGGKQKFDATVKNATDSSVAWSIEGASSGNTKIDQNGLLVISDDEVVGTTIKVHAISKEESTKLATATVKVIAKNDGLNPVHPKDPIKPSINPKGTSVAQSKAVHTGDDTYLSFLYTMLAASAFTFVLLMKRKKFEVNNS